jgi:hypothetical protein
MNAKKLSNFAAVKTEHGFVVGQHLYMQPQGCCACYYYCLRHHEAGPFPRFFPTCFTSPQQQSEEMPFQSSCRQGAALQQGWLCYQETASQSLVSSTISCSTRTCFVPVPDDFTFCHRMESTNSQISLGLLSDQKVEMLSLRASMGHLKSSTMVSLWPRR